MPQQKQIDFQPIDFQPEIGGKPAQDKPKPQSFSDIMTQLGKYGESRAGFAQRALGGALGFLGAFVPGGPVAEGAAAGALGYSGSKVGAGEVPTVGGIVGSAAAGATLGAAVPAVKLLAKLPPAVRRHIPFGIGKAQKIADLIEAVKKAGAATVPKQTRDELAYAWYAERTGAEPATAADKIRAIRELRQELNLKTKPTPPELVPGETVRASATVSKRLPLETGETTSASAVVPGRQPLQAGETVSAAATVPSRLPKEQGPTISSGVHTVVRKSAKTGGGGGKPALTDQAVVRGMSQGMGGPPGSTGPVDAVGNPLPQALEALRSKLGMSHGEFEASIARLADEGKLTLTPGQGHGGAVMIEGKPYVAATLRGEAYYGDPLGRGRMAIDASQFKKDDAMARYFIKKNIGPDKVLEMDEQELNTHLKLNHYQPPRKYAGGVIPETATHRPVELVKGDIVMRMKELIKELQGQ